MEMKKNTLYVHNGKKKQKTKYKKQKQTRTFEKSNVM